MHTSVHIAIQNVFNPKNKTLKMWRRVGRLDKLVILRNVLIVIIEMCFIKNAKTKSHFCVENAYNESAY